MLKREIAREPLDTTTAIETPEHVRFHYHLAGPTRRALAWLIDSLVRGALALVAVLLAIFAGMDRDGFGKASTGVVLVVLFLLEWGYYVFFESVWSGRTPGKRALSLRVVTQRGHPLTFRDSLLRNLLRAADFLPAAYALGAAMMGRDARFRRLGDLVAGTLVIAEESRTVAAPLRLEPPPSKDELRWLPQRVPLSGDELEAVELFLRRLARLSFGRQRELADLVAPVFARRMGLGRIHDSVRFLGVLRHRAREGQGGST